MTKDLQMLQRIIESQAYPRGFGPSRWWTLGIGNRRVTERAIVAYLLGGEGWAV